eukprot:2494029-Amphidinium_carterae.1
MAPLQPVTHTWHMIAGKSFGSGQGSETGSLESNTCTLGTHSPRSRKYTLLCAAAALATRLAAMHFNCRDFGFGKGSYRA